MSIEVRRVRLPNGKEAFEFKREFGASETQESYEYRKADGTLINPEKLGFDRNYWGKIEGLVEMDFVPSEKIQKLIMDQFRDKLPEPQTKKPITLVITWSEAIESYIVKMRPDQGFDIGAPTVPEALRALADELDKGHKQVKDDATYDAVREHGITKSRKK